MARMSLVHYGNGTPDRCAVWDLDLKVVAEQDVEDKALVKPLELLRRRVPSVECQFGDLYPLEPGC